jgi:hypothetical protein
MAERGGADAADRAAVPLLEALARIIWQLIDDHRLVTKHGVESVLSYHPSTRV